MTQFILTGAMVEHLKLLQDEEVLGRALCLLFRHKVDGDDFTCKPEEFPKMGFVVALLRDDMNKADKVKDRMRSVREHKTVVAEQKAVCSRTQANGSQTAENGSQTPCSSPEKETNEREVSPHTPYIEKESKERVPSPTPHLIAGLTENEVLSLFNKFWESYPNVRRVDKQKSCSKFSAILRDCKTKDNAIKKFDEIMAGLAKWKVSRMWTQDGGQYVCMPMTFLNNERWTAEVKGAGDGSYKSTEAAGLF